MHLSRYLETDRRVLLSGASPFFVATLIDMSTFNSRLKKQESQQHDPYFLNLNTVTHKQTIKNYSLQQTAYICHTNLVYSMRKLFRDG
jgi:hypothetical protein